MFGLSNTLTIGLVGALTTVGAGVGGFFYGQSVGEDRVELAWEKENNKELEEELAYKTQVMQTISNLRESNAKLSETVRVVYNDRVDTITETKYVNRDVIKEVFRDSPFMTKGWVYTHDRLAQNKPIDFTKAQNSEPSKYTWLDSLDVIRENYSLAETARQKDEAWNNFYNGVRANFDRVQDDRDETGDSESPAAANGTRATLTGTENN